MIEFASATPAGVTLINVNSRDIRVQRDLVYGSDTWANGNELFASASSDDKLPASVYFAELERSWSKDRIESMRHGVTCMCVDCVQADEPFHARKRRVERDSQTYMGTSLTDIGTFYNDGDNRAALHTGLAESEELPIGHAILNHMFGATKGYNGPRFVYRSWTTLVATNWPSHQRAIIRAIR